MTPSRPLASTGDEEEYTASFSLTCTLTMKYTESYYQIIRCHEQEDYNMDIHQPGNSTVYLKSHL
jgi:hypothetical protein